MPDKNRKPLRLAVRPSAGVGESRKSGWRLHASDVNDDHVRSRVLKTAKRGRRDAAEGVKTFHRDLD